MVKRSTSLFFHWSRNPGGHSITKRTGGWLKGLNQKPQTIYPKTAIFKRLAIFRRLAIWDKFLFSLRIVPLIIHMNRFRYPLTIVQINIFEEPQNIFSNQNPRPQTIEPAPCIFNYRVPPPGVEKAKLMTVTTSSLAFTPEMKTSSDSLCPTIIILPYSTLPYMYSVH